MIYQSKKKEQTFPKSLEVFFSDKKEGWKVFLTLFTQHRWPPVFLPAVINSAFTLH